MDKKFRVAHKSYTSQNLFAISAWIEEKTINGYPIYSDVIFLEFTEKYDSGKKISIKVDATDLRAMGYAVKELLKNKKTEYKKFTDPKLAGRGGDKNKISLICDAKGYYINAESGGHTIGMAFDPHRFAGVSDSISLIADETEKMCYHFQRSAANH